MVRILRRLLAVVAALALLGTAAALVLALSPSDLPEVSPIQLPLPADGTEPDISPSQSRKAPERVDSPAPGNAGSDERTPTGTAEDNGAGGEAGETGDDAETGGDRDDDGPGGDGSEGEDDDEGGD